MASRKARQRFNRRDRRKAKESDYQRLPKGSPKKVGHGTSGSIQIFSDSPPKPAVTTPTSPKSLRVKRRHWYDHIGKPPPRDPPETKSSFGANIVESIDAKTLDKLEGK